MTKRTSLAAKQTRSTGPAAFVYFAESEGPDSQTLKFTTDVVLKKEEVQIQLVDLANDVLPDPPLTRGANQPNANTIEIDRGGLAAGVYYIAPNQELLTDALGATPYGVFVIDE